jgi:NADPH2:quinone reductase
MRALRFHRFGAPDVLTLDEVVLPVPGPDEARIEVHAVGVNFADTERRRGLYLATRPLPVISGFEGAGVVVETSVEAWRGRRVAFLCDGAAAEYCVAPLSKLIPLPAEVDFVRGAAFPVQGLSAWHTLFSVGQLVRGETVCITAAAGGVGLLATQLAKAAGAHVIGLVSREEKKAIAFESGADEVFVGFNASALKSRVDVLLDSIGADTSDFGFEVLRPFGRWVMFGEASGPARLIDPNRLIEKSLRVGGWWLRTEHPPRLWNEALEHVIAGVANQQLRQRITLYRLEEAVAAHRALESRQSTGKLVLTVEPRISLAV